MIFKKKHKLQWDTRFNNGPFTKHEKKQIIFRELRKKVKCISELRNDNMGLTEIWSNSLINTKKGI